MMSELKKTFFSSLTARQIKLDSTALVSFSGQYDICGYHRSLPHSGAHERFFTRVGSGLAHRHQTRLERLARDTQSCLLRKSVNCGLNKFYDKGPRSLSEWSPLLSPIVEIVLIKPKIYYGKTLQLILPNHQRQKMFLRRLA